MSDVLQEADFEEIVRRGAQQEAKKDVSASGANTDRPHYSLLRP